MTSWKDPEIAGVRALLAARQPGPGAPTPTVAERRAAMDAAGEIGALPTGCFHEPATLGGVKCERVVPHGAAPGRMLLYLHGGAYTAGSPRSHRPLVARLADVAHTVAVAADYRMGPEHRFPAAVEDAVAVYRALLDGGTEPGQLIVAGDSAGGGLALALALALKAEGLPQPAGFFVISPWADLTQSGASYRTKADTDPMITKAGLDTHAMAYLGGLDAHDPLASPVFGDFEGVAPILIQTGSEEALLSDSITMADVLAHARVEVRLEVWPEMIHVFHAWGGGLQAARRAIKLAGAWMDEKFAG
ncbi:MAG: alpha/beta hydrolase [Alphaproteobacteria bacterium]|nr:alpha/beta hydrolase [Alphaproteobacteria bacterium]MBU1513550.1 alpha/beta hydrolase [Alphaproteobacteria bacterium]MBU2094805.1 alpha/beta hydrolase [Alphaproteobacteria bacterium]MBU2151062.1 alpha/beta hydrolase [Alphaproteobacteria bacterium]MBU2309345.1 alpha/beta hydrolase [Alphaproteobacteria bacterium]